MSISVILAAGGTAGHVNPMLATAKALAARVPDASIVTVGTNTGMEVDLVDAAGLRMRTIERVPMPRKPDMAALRFPRSFTKAVKQAERILAEEQADVVVGYGGYVSTPVYLAAKRRKIPIVVHEGNARPGMANKLGARFAKVVALTFANTKLTAKNGVTETIGLPMRTLITELAHADGGRRARREEYAREFGFDPARPIMVVTGGSSGAQHINEVVASAGSDITAQGIQVLHLTGRGKDQPVRDAVSDLSSGAYTVLDYLESMDKAYAVADLVVTRAGAGMVAEVSALGIPAIFIPLPIGNGEQALNAHDVVHAGGALLVRNENFCEEWIREQLIPLFTGDRLERMAARASSVSPLTAADRLAEIITDVAE